MYEAFEMTEDIRKVYQNERDNADSGNERLANLALLHTHYDQHIDIEMVIDNYAQMLPRRIESETLVV